MGSTYTRFVLCWCNHHQLHYYYIISFVLYYEAHYYNLPSPLLFSLLTSTTPWYSVSPPLFTPGCSLKDRAVLCLVPSSGQTKSNHAQNHFLFHPIVNILSYRSSGPNIPFLHYHSGLRSCGPGDGLATLYYVEVVLGSWTATFLFHVARPHHSDHFCSVKVTKEKSLFILLPLERARAVKH